MFPVNENHDEIKKGKNRGEKTTHSVSLSVSNRKQVQEGLSKTIRKSMSIIRQALVPYRSNKQFLGRVKMRSPC